MVVSVERLEEHLEEISKMIKQLPSQINRLHKQMQLCDQEEQDILHTIEFTSFNAHEGWKLAKDIQLTREVRRRAKDELFSLERVFDRLKVSRTFGSHVEISNNLLKGHKDSREGRTYTLKIRKDLANEKLGIICNKKTKL